MAYLYNKTVKLFMLVVQFNLGLDVIYLLRVQIN